MSRRGKGITGRCEAVGAECRSLLFCKGKSLEALRCWERGINRASKHTILCSLEAEIKGGENSKLTLTPAYATLIIAQTVRTVTAVGSSAVDAGSSPCSTAAVPLAGAQQHHWMLFSEPNGPFQYPAHVPVICSVENNNNHHQNALRGHRAILEPSLM